MPIVKETEWNGHVERNQDPYSKCCVDVAREVMNRLDTDEYKDLDAHTIICDADKGIEAGGITGFMAGCVAQMVTQCHSRGAEFQKSWNKSWGSDSETGVVNPAIVSVGV